MEVLSSEVVSEIHMKQADRHCEYLEIEFKAESRANAEAQSMAEKHQGGQRGRGRGDRTED